MAGWVGQRECEHCSYEGPETDFTIVGLMVEAVYVVALWDGEGSNEVTVCRDCVADLSARSLDELLSLVRAWVRPVTVAARAS